VTRRAKLLLLGVIVVSAAIGAIVGVLRSSAGTPAPPAALERVRIAGDALPPAAADALASRGLEVGASRRISANGFLVPRPAQHELCLVTVLSDELPFSCNPTGDFFHGKRFVFDVVSDGRPGHPTRLEVAGVSRVSPATVRIEFSGDTRRVALSQDGGFAYEADAAALQLGDPRALSLLDPSGRLLETQLVGGY
jgi:hypothetical protein